jgi:immune inhibitor A
MRCQGIARLAYWTIALAAAWSARAEAQATRLEPPHCIALPHGDESDAMARQQHGLRNAFQGNAPQTSRPLRAKGSAHLLVILAEFAGKPHRIDPSRFQTLLFGSQNSVASYYDLASEEAFDLTGDLYGWVTLPSSQSTYSAGEGGVGDYPNNGQKMAEDAVPAVIDDGLDLGPYDRDDDGFVDALLVIHSGQGLEWCASANNTPQPDLNAINSHKWVVRDQTFGQDTKIGEYFTCPELQIVRSAISPAWTDSISTIGVYCHEFGHILGLPDLYDSGNGDVRLGVWDLMDSGSWNPSSSDSFAPGSIPSELSAWTKMFLHWVEPVILAPKVGEVLTSTETLEPITLGNQPLQFLENAGGVDWVNGSTGRGEYFLAELRTRAEFDGGIPDSGVLIYHVDESRESNRASDNPDGGRLLLLAPQDGTIGLGLTDSRNDSWPGAKDEFSETTTPSSLRYDGTPSGLTLSSIDVQAGSPERATMNVSIVNLDPLPEFPFARPNPWNMQHNARTEIVLRALNQQVAQGTRILIHDLSGRFLNVLDEDDFAEDRRVALWDGMDQSGSIVPAGVYFYRVEEPGSAARTGRIILLR